MNPEDSDDRLLDALLADQAALDAMRSAGLVAMRHRRWQHAARMIFAGAAAAVFIICATQPWRDRTSSADQGNALARIETRLPSATRDLTDEELLRQFPPGTCTLAEMNGQKTLVFLTEEARVNYLR